VYSRVSPQLLAADPALRRTLVPCSTSLQKLQSPVDLKKPRGREASLRRDRPGALRATPLHRLLLRDRKKPRGREASLRSDPPGACAGYSFTPTPHRRWPSALLLLRDWPCTASWAGRVLASFPAPALQSHRPCRMQKQNVKTGRVPPSGLAVYSLAPSCDAPASLMHPRCAESPSRSMH